MSVWPVTVELAIGRGQTTHAVINVENESGEAIALQVHVMDFSVGKDNDFVLSAPGHETYSCSKWLSVTEPGFDLAPGDTKEVNVAISVPETVEPGGHYAALLFEAIPAEAAPGLSVAVRSRIASIFYLTIPGTTEADVFADADIVSLTLPGFAHGGPIETGVLVRNTGNVHLTIAARATFTGFRNRKVGEADLGQAIVLPHSERLLKGDWENTPFLDRITASVVIGYYDEHGELVNESQSATFWAIPKTSIVVALAAVVALLPPTLWLLATRYRLRVERRH